MERTPSTAGPARRNGSAPAWWKSARILEVRVEAIRDSNGDGIGDFAGLADMVPMFAQAGYDALWLTPFFPSPLQDGGYDVTDYDGVDPRFGTPDDFEAFTEAAKRHGTKVIVDLPLCHTSDQHPWFVSSRANPDGEYGDWYIWHPRGDECVSYVDEHGDPQPVRNMLIDDPDPRMVVDGDGHRVPALCWSHDEVRGEWYFHRFKRCQPALNYRNPAVLERMLATMRLWIDAGVDGFRLDALPYLLLEDRTSCEDLPGVHDYVRELRRKLDPYHPDGEVVLLCEADVGDVARYVRPGECQLAFGFPLRRAAFIGNAERHPRHVLEVADAASLPAGGGAIVKAVSTHDDLRMLHDGVPYLELVHGHYGTGRRGRPFLDGVVGSFASLLDHDRRTMERVWVERATALPGPVVDYYLDLLAVGHHTALVEPGVVDHDQRDAIRLPLPATADGGFSVAEDAALFRPYGDDPRSPVELANWATQVADAGSWLRFVIAFNALLAHNPILCLGSSEALVPQPGSAPEAWGRLRRFSDDAVIVAFNPARGWRRLRASLPAGTPLRLRGAALVELASGEEVGRLRGRTVDLALPGDGWLLARLVPRR